MVVPEATSVAPLPGCNWLTITVGAGSVENLAMKSAGSGILERSLAPLAIIVVKTVPGLSGRLKSTVNTFLPASQD